MADRDGILEKAEAVVLPKIPDVPGDLQVIVAETMRALVIKDVLSGGKFDCLERRLLRALLRVAGERDQARSRPAAEGGE